MIEQFPRVRDEPCRSVLAKEAREAGKSQVWQELDGETGTGAGWGEEGLQSRRAERGLEVRERVEDVRARVEEERRELAIRSEVSSKVLRREVY